MITSANSLRVAILGSGISGSSAARSLAEKGIKVSVFEAGYGIGGRTSTRIKPTSEDNQCYQFDHGAQYISSPKTDAFRKTLKQWEKDGWIKNWSGEFYTINYSSSTIQKEKEETRKERYVGYPAMNSICHNLLNHTNIQVNTQTRANALYDNTSSTSCWKLIHEKNRNKTNLGTFDWIIATDRNSGNHFRKDLISGNVDEFRNGIRGIKSIKSLTAMVVFETALDLGVDGIQFDYGNKNYNDITEENGNPNLALGWAARDSSKPGRERKDGKECWVLQSTPSAAKTILKDIKTKKIEVIREVAKDVLVNDFLKFLENYNVNGIENYSIPSVEDSIGHRWGAAFPILSEQYKKMDSQLVADKHFVACGDYFGALSGRIEGAYLSGISAANKLCQQESIN